MSGETSLKFLIPESSCQKDFEVWALFADGAKESVLRCDWVKKYYCDSAPGYTHTLENSTALITLPRDLEKKPDDFICDSLFRPKTDPIMCLCKRAAISIPVQSDSDSPEQVGFIAGMVIAISVILFLVVFLIYKRYRTSSKSKHDPNVRPDECQPLRKDSQKSLLTFFPCGTVPPRKKPMTQWPHPELYNLRRRESI
ncbi:uncharacterized protein LOC112567443 [Pomacea canaliculata]|uniref:uncharacterized protein LOC112567443 n=1 Tax=Pomacea canaliculata TaxID=400727 RepID=UPI000D733E07|nr:uncharacterized protein LOC112567443 [Pomacea canaliculata]